MSYKTYMYHPCKCKECGILPTYDGSQYMSDRYFCKQCGKTTQWYFDGQEYALQEWCKMNDGKLVKEEIYHP